MIREIEIKVLPKVASNNLMLKNVISQNLKISNSDINHIKLLKRSVDARQKQVKIYLKIRVFINEEYTEKKDELKLNSVHSSNTVHIIGCGPAGMFAALKLIEIGIKPIIIERGKDVRSRRRDLVNITKNHIVNGDSNYCFGEGGAGTYSDGKLYTRSKKRGDVEKILDLLILHGANPEIKIDSHPHIGTDKLPIIVSEIRKTILEHGGEIHFNTKLIDIHIEKNQIKSISLSNGRKIQINKMILATGHSARDIYTMLKDKKILIEAKPFAVGVRVEHPQSLIDKIQYNCETRSKYLPPSPYNVVNQIDNRGVYSFCMCPGGIIAPCATSQKEVVTNGWSPSKRNFPKANSGIVVELKIDDFMNNKFGALSGVEFQKKIEHKAWKLAGKSQKVPAQRLIDFIENKKSIDIPETSYIAGTSSVKISELMPDFIYSRLKKAFTIFGSQMKGYLTNEAIVHAPETRTSSPVRIPRLKDTFEHPEIKGLFPCGEGAGYAGGIISAAIDGQKCAEMCKL